MDVTIPDDLVALVSERRVIPFLGAGFSSALGFPDWNGLLATLAKEVDDALPYEELQSYTNNDPLQIAEYLYLKCDERIGPLRHVIERGLPADVAPIRSAAHVELVNLGAPQIYTTNYDDLIEVTYRALGVPVSVVALPKDVAAAKSEVTQVVKYHGDLRHEATLVLTESSYYRRLDFESPMDLKFRSDLLGRSVLFMGYSFRDINIRIIWFKLMQMMKDIPAADRRQSYIVRLEPNPVLEELYQAVGLKTIVLDTGGEAKSPETRSNILGEFLYQLSSSASSSTDRMFVSTGLIQSMSDELKKVETTLAPVFRSTVRRTERLRRLGLGLSGLTGMAQVFLTRHIPPQLLEDARPCFLQLLDSFAFTSNDVPRIVELARLMGPAAEVTQAIGEVLLRPPYRQRLLRTKDIPWRIIWSSTISSDSAESILEAVEREVNFNERGEVDEDIAYAVDVAARIAQGQIIEPSSKELQSRAKDLLERTVKLYSAAKNYSPKLDGPPSVDKILAQIEARSKEISEAKVLAGENHTE